MFAVVTAKVAADAPAGMLTLPGVMAAALLLLIDSIDPPWGAGFVRLMLQFVCPPLGTLDGLQLMLETSIGAVIARVAC
jgi:hypothetical protein